MRRLISYAANCRLTAFIARCALALRYMRRLNYSRRLAWAIAAR